MFIDNKYRKMYYKIIENIKPGTGPFENHHIIPKSLGGTDEDSNLVLLTPRAHFICHWLLTKFTEGNDKRKMQYALWNMTRVSKNHQRVVTSSQYEIARSSYIKAVSSRVCSAETRAKISAIHKGKTVSIASIEKRKNTLKQKGIKIQSTATWEICFPNGVIVTVTNLAEFCRTHSLSQSGLSRLNSGALKYYKGFSCKKLHTLGGLEIINAIE